MFFLFVLLFFKTAYFSYADHKGFADYEERFFSFSSGGPDIVSPYGALFLNLALAGSETVVARRQGGQFPDDHRNVFEAIMQNDLIAVVLYVRYSPHVLEEKDHSGFTPLQRASQIGHLGMVEFLVSQGGGRHVIMTNEEGDTALHLTYSVKVAKVLVEAGLDFERENHKGETPLSLARQSGHHELVRYYVSLQEET